MFPATMPLTRTPPPRPTRVGSNAAEAGALSPAVGSRLRTQPARPASNRPRRRWWPVTLAGALTLIAPALLSAISIVAGGDAADRVAEVAAVRSSSPPATILGSASLLGARPTPTPSPSPSPAPVESCGVTDVGACADAVANAFVTKVVDAFFKNVTDNALNPLLGLLSDSLLTTPTPDSLPALATLWNQSWQILLACYGLLILAGGVVLMAYGSVQSRYSFKEIAPRVVVGFLAGALSLGIAEQAVELANALSRAVLGDGLDPKTVGDTLAQLVTSPLNYNIFAQLFVFFLVGMLIAVLLGWVIRVCATVTLIAGAPLFLMWHALGQTEAVAYWWWRAIGGCLAIQVVQSLALVTSLKVLLTPGGFEWFGPNRNGWTNDLVALALIWVLYRIPFWVLGAIRRVGGQRTLVGGLARTAVTVAVLRAVR